MTEPEKAKGIDSFMTRLSLKIARNWLRIALVVVGTYAILPWVAPTLMRLGATAPANVLYTLYSPMCHQFAFRSIFLYGDQAFYPRESVGTDLVPYEAYALEIDSLNPGTGVDDFTPQFFIPARQFRGNEQMGYKTAICARDAAIYLALFAGGLVFAIPAVRRRLRPIPLWIYVIAGLGPIGLDGFSQLLGYYPFELWATRETAPFFRVATGTMFGLMTAWLIFPYLERSFWETKRDIIERYRAEGIEA
ncbi:MAG: DUF2085 domain-containing protein [Chloroflexota bacterium]